MLVKQYVPQGRGYAATEQHKRWTTADCTEVKCNKNKTKVQIEDIQLTAAQNQDTEVVHTQRAERNEEVYITPGLVNYCLRQEAKNTLLQMNHDENNRLAGVSDGSVRDSREQGTWAWALLEYDERRENSTPLLWGIEGKGREYVEGLDTHEVHSYRMEALGLLSALQYVRSELKWKGKLDWYMDSQAVIDTFAKCHRLNDSRWIKQRDKDVWVELIKEKKRWGKGRITIHHVESHVDTKRDKDGQLRVPTPIQWMNIYADKLADEVYDSNMPALNTSSLRTYGQWNIMKNKHMITGHWRNQIKEEIRLDRSKKGANKDKLMWGLCPDEIDWGRMRKTSGNKTIRERLKAAKLMGGRRATNTFLKRFGITATDTCTLCGEYKETNRHALCFCNNINLQNARANTGKLIAETIRAVGAAPELIQIFKNIYGNSDAGRATTMNGLRTKEGKTRLQFPKEWHTVWRKANKKETRTLLEEGQSRAAEIAVTMGGATPLWTGNITKAWM